VLFGLASYFDGSNDLNWQRLPQKVNWILKQETMVPTNYCTQRKLDI